MEIYNSILVGLIGENVDTDTEDEAMTSDICDPVSWFHETIRKMIKCLNVMKTTKLNCKIWKSYTIYLKQQAQPYFIIMKIARIGK